MLDVDKTTRVEMDWSGPERLQMNMGPQHPSAHGVFRAIVTLEGETVVAVDAVIGYLHRCHEKLFEALVGARLLYGFFQVGGTRYDIPDGWAQTCRETIDLIDSRIDEYEQML